MQASAVFAVSFCYVFVVSAAVHRHARVTSPLPVSMSHVTVRNFARIVALELVHALALGLKYLLQRTSLSVFLTRERSTYIVFMLAAAAAEAIEVGTAPRSLPPR